jgi:hypothetical protein
MPIAWQKDLHKQLQLARTICAASQHERFAEQCTAKHHKRKSHDEITARGMNNASNRYVLAI